MQDDTGRVHQRKQSSTQSVLRHEDCLDISCLELIIVEVKHGTVHFHCGIKIFVETQLAEGCHRFWVRTCSVKVPCMSTVVAQLVDLTMVVLRRWEMMISVKVGCFGGLW